MNIQVEQFIPHILVVIGVILLLEYGLQSFWSRSYFMRGLIIFRVRRKVKLNNNELPVLNFEQVFCGVNGIFGIPVIPSIKFNKIDSSNYAFREKYWIPSLYIPIMRGLVSLNMNDGFIIFTGRLNYTPILISSLIIALNLFFEFNKKNNSLLLLLLLMSFLILQIFRYYYISFKTINILKRHSFF